MAEPPGSLLFSRLLSVQGICPLLENHDGGQQLPCGRKYSTVSFQSKCGFWSRVQGTRCEGQFTSGGWEPDLCLLAKTGRFSTNTRDSW